jgi:hypothetical protein
MNLPNDRNAVYNLLMLVREQNDAIHQLRLKLGALMWMVLHGDEDKMREFAATEWQIDHARPDVDNERDSQWRAWLMSVQREVERDRPEIPS